MMANFEVFLTHSLEKVFPDMRPKELKNRSFTLLKNDRWSCQLVYYMEPEQVWRDKYWFSIEVEGVECDLSKDCFRKVELVPSEFPAGNNCDTNYIRTRPGLYPDLLRKSDDRAYFLSNQYRSIWIDIPLNQLKIGINEIYIRVVLDSEKMLGNGKVVECNDISKFIYEEKVKLEVIDQELPTQKLIHTEWFHADCLANYYQVNMWSEEHWCIVENFIAFAGKRAGINMLLTPVFTPPLDTMKGKNRRTTQLVDVKKKRDTYYFQFDKLDKWCKICKKYGIKYLEIPQLFTQWGAEATPHIEVSVDDCIIDMFGWHVGATDPAYKEFLEQFIPALTERIVKNGYDKRDIYFHISDEPLLEHVESYREARNVVHELIQEYKVIDALSDYEFYKKGLIDIPVPANDHADDFYKQGVDPFWTYYCVSQGYQVPNRFFAMPSARNAIMGILLYLYQAEGFLHWGYNFYNAQYSMRAIDPYKNTDADKAFISGDAFLVYPGENYEPETSLRNEVQMDGLADLRALYLLENLIGRSAVIELIHEGVDERLSFTQYPISSEYILQLRQRIRLKIREFLC